MKHCLLRVALVFLLAGCADESANAPDPGSSQRDTGAAGAAGAAGEGTSTGEGRTSHVIQGVVTSAGTPVEGAEVSLDDAAAWSTRTKHDGSFVLSDVSSGEHLVHVQSGATAGSFQMRSTSIDVEDAVELTIRLPNPVRLEVSGDGPLRLEWSATDADDFREYKLYAHDTPGLDETTGELLFVGTSRDESSFVHQDLEGHTEYFYRVFVLNEFGQLAGSNIVSKTTSAKNLIVDGGFESGTLDAWDVRQGNVQIESERVHDGQYSVYLNNAEREICCPNVLMTSTYPVSLVAGTRYELSAWIKAEGVNNGMGSVWIDVIVGDDNYVTGLDFGHETNVTIPGPIDTIDWEYHSRTFVAPLGGTSVIQIHSPFSDVWIDELTLLAL